MPECHSISSLDMRNLEICLKQTIPPIQCPEGILTSVSPKSRCHLVRKQLADRNYSLSPNHCFGIRSCYLMKEMVLLSFAHDVSAFDFSCNLSSVELILISWGKLYNLQGDF